MAVVTAAATGVAAMAAVMLPMARARRSRPWRPRLCANWHHGGGGHHAGKGHKNYYAHNYNHHRYYRYGRYYRNYRWYGGAYAYGYGYGNCAWLRRQALITNSPYWWNRYYSCIN